MNSRQGTPLLLLGLLHVWAYSLALLALLTVPVALLGGIWVAAMTGVDWAWFAVAAAAALALPASLQAAAAVERTIEPNRL